MAHFIWLVRRNAHVSLLNNLKDFNCGHVRNFVTLSNISIRFGSELFRKSIGIPMGTNFAPLVADLFLF